MKKKLEVLGEFVAHVLLGTAVFIIIALAALLLAIFTHWIGSFVVGKPLFLSILEFVEMAIFLGDCGLLMWWVLKSTIDACRKL